MVATRDIKPGEVIFVEEPLSYGPSENTKPVCIGCYSPKISQNSPCCKRCGFPVCSESCSEIPEHRDYECSVLFKNNYKVKHQLISVLIHIMNQITCYFSYEKQFYKLHLVIGRCYEIQVWRRRRKLCHCVAIKAVDVEANRYFYFLCIDYCLMHIISTASIIHKYYTSYYINP